MRNELEKVEVLIVTTKVNKNWKWREKTEGVSSLLEKARTKNKLGKAEGVISVSERK